jgi:hypothetical protein
MPEPLKVTKQAQEIVLPAELLRKRITVSNAKGGEMALIFDSPKLDNLIARISAGANHAFVTETNLWAQSTGESQLTVNAYQYD